MKTDMHHHQFPLGKILLGTLVLGIASLAFYNTRDIIFGAPLTVENAHDGATISDSYLTLSGRAPHARELRINGRMVTFDRSGAFADGVMLSPGYNMIEVASRDRFGNQKKKTYHVVATPPATDPLARAGDAAYQ